VSYKVVKQVLNIDPAKLPGVGERFTLTVLAEHADPDGSNTFPALPRIARLLGVSEDQAYRWRRSLREDGWIILTKRTRYYSVFKIDMAKVADAAWIEPARLCIDAESDPNPDSAPMQSPDPAPMQSLTLHSARRDSAPMQSNSSLPDPDSSEDSPTPPPVRVSVLSAKPNAPENPKKPKDPMTEFYEAVAFHAWMAFTGEESDMTPSMKTRAVMGRSVREVLNFEDDNQWMTLPPSIKEVRENVEGVIRVMEYARRAQVKQADRYLLKNPLKIMEPENFDVLMAEADRALKTLDDNSRGEIGSIMECWDSYLEETTKGSAA